MNVQSFEEEVADGGFDNNQPRDTSAVLNYMNADSSSVETAESEETESPEILGTVKVHSSSSGEVREEQQRAPETARELLSLDRCGQPPHRGLLKKSQSSARPFSGATRISSLGTQIIAVRREPMGFETNFREIEPHREGKKITVTQHTARVQTRLQSKLSRYGLNIQIAVYEMAHGPILIPPNVQPPEPAPPDGDLANDPMAMRAFEYIKQAGEAFLRSQ